MDILVHLWSISSIVGSVAFGVTMLGARYRGDLDIVRHYIPLFEIMPTSKAGHLLKFAVFVAVGTAVAMIMSQPASLQQGFSAGIGWTALLVRTKAPGATIGKGRRQAG